MVTPDTLYPRLIACGISPLDIVGCSEEEIEHVEATAGRKLPASYVQFLSLIGRGAGEFMSDLTVFYPAVLTLTESSRELTAAYPVLPDDAFVFVGRYGEVLLFFRFGDDPNDPAVYRWTDDRPRRTKKVFKSIWEFVEEELSGFEPDM